VAPSGGERGRTTSDGLGFGAGVATGRPVLMNAMRAQASASGLPGPRTWSGHRHLGGIDQHRRRVGPCFAVMRVDSQRRNRVARRITRDCSAGSLPGRRTWHFARIMGIAALALDTWFRVRMGAGHRACWMARGAVSVRSKLIRPGRWKGLTSCGIAVGRTWDR
jgi:hypothetical protein